MIAKTAIIDPPWPYAKVGNSRKLSGYLNGGGDVQYKTMTISDMARLPVSSCVSDYLFMWVVGPFVREALQLFDAWSFEYKSQMVWVKITGLGVGYWFRGDHELIFVGKKKNSPSIRTNERSVLRDEHDILLAARTPHSSKPADLHQIIEKHFPGPYLEIFARKYRDGWSTVGDAVDGLDITESLGEYING